MAMKLAPVLGDDLFPISQHRSGSSGSREVGETEFAVPKGSLGFWKDRLVAKDVTGLEADQLFGAERLRFEGPDGDGFALVESADDNRAPWIGAGVSEDVAIRGFRGARMRLHDIDASAELLTFMGYQRAETEGNVSRFIMPNGNGADTIDLEALPSAQAARQGRVPSTISLSRCRTGLHSLKCARH